MLVDHVVLGGIVLIGLLLSLLTDVFGLKLLIMILTGIIVVFVTEFCLGD